MDRLQKKCFVASTGLHLLLGLILLVGPAFLVSKNKRDDMLPMNFVAQKTVDEALQGGGDPAAKPPPATFEKPQPLPPPPVVKPAAPEPAKIKEPEPIKEVVKEPTPSKEPDFSFEPAKDRKAKKPTFEFTPVTKPTRDLQAEAQAKAQAEATEQERQYRKALADRQRGLRSTVGNALNNLEEGRAGSTEKVVLGPGGGGPSYANFYQQVKSIYKAAWVVPDGITDNNATVGTEITIARDGTVVSWRITRSSGNAGVDRSVRVTLERVKQAVPLPDSEKANQRTVGINFNVAAKRGLG